MSSDRSRLAALPARYGALVLPVLVAVAMSACSGSPSGTTPASPDHTSAAVTPEPTPAGPTPIAIAKQDPEPPLTLLWDKAGATPNAGETSVVAVAPGGNVWAVSARDAVIWEFKPDGTYVGSHGSAGHGEGQFTFLDRSGNPWGGIAFAKDGSFVVSDAGNTRVQMFDKTGGFVRVIGKFGTGDGEFAQPVGVAIDAQGNVLVADGNRNDIQEFGPDGSFIRKVAGGLDYGTAPVPWLTVDPAGNILTTVGRTIVELTPNGERVAAFDLSAYGYPGGIATDANGNIWATINSAINPSTKPGPLIEFDPHGKVLHVWPATGDEIALDPAGTAVYQALFTAPNVQKYALP